jgi:hypothetical protein
MHRQLKRRPRALRLAQNRRPRSLNCLAAHCQRMNNLGHVRPRSPHHRLATRPRTARLHHVGRVQRNGTSPRTACSPPATASPTASMVTGATPTCSSRRSAGDISRADGTLVS